MALKGSKKALANEHERGIAELYDGCRSNSSGGAVTDEGDVRVISDGTLFECKLKGGERLGDRAVRSTLVAQMAKIADEAWSIGKEPALALRFYMPDHVLADPEGWVDLVVRLAEDDAYRTERIARGHRCGEEGRCH